MLPADPNVLRIGPELDGLRFERFVSAEALLDMIARLRRVALASRHVATAQPTKVSGLIGADLLDRAIRALEPGDLGEED